MLSWAWIAHTIEVDNLVEAAGAERVGRNVPISLPMWTNGLRFIDEDGITVDELQTRARAACNIGGLERWGWISVGEPGPDRRNGYGSHRGVKGDTVLRPTRAGRYARRLWPRALGDVDGRWRSRFGDGLIDGLRAALNPLVRAMPWSPPEVNPSDGFRTRVVKGDTPDPERPLGVLLGQVLTYLTLEHERGAEVSLPLGANIVRVVDSEAVRLRDLPSLTGISKEAIAMAVGYLQRHGLADRTPERTVSLTTAGLNALDDYRLWAGRPKHKALHEALASIVERSQELAAGLVPPEGCWRGERPYLAQTQRVLANPTGALPWHPMVLHRAGWPDGS
jgi:hypothetical protein